MAHLKDDFVAVATSQFFMRQHNRIADDDFRRNRHIAALVKEKDEAAVSL